MRKASSGILILVAGVLAAGAAHATAVVLVAEDGGYDPATLQTVRTIASNALRARGVPLADDPRYHTTVPLTDEVLQAASEQGTTQLFVLRFGPLGAKVMISLEELEAPNSTPLYVATLIAENIEESDTVVPRLVDSVLDRVPVENTATVATLTAEESEEFRKKPGEGLWILGLGVAPLGGSLGWSHEAVNWRLGAVFLGANDNPTFTGFEGALIPLVGDISPYVGLGIGIVAPPADNEGDAKAKLGGKLDIGVEFFRLHGVRLLVEVSAVIPFGSMPGSEDLNPGAWVRLGL